MKIEEFIRARLEEAPHDPLDLLVLQHHTDTGLPCATLREMAARWSTHPEYEEIEMILKFEKPTPLIPPPSQCKEIAEALRENPGQWALVGRSKSGGAAAGQRAYMFRHGLQDGFTPAGSFEAEARTVIGEHRVYVRYVGSSE